MSEPQRDLSKYIEHIPEEESTPTPRPRKPKPATKEEAADVEVAYARSFYAGAANAATPCVLP